MKMEIPFPFCVPVAAGIVSVSLFGSERLFMGVSTELKLKKTRFCY